MEANYLKFQINTGVLTPGEALYVVHYVLRQCISYRP